MLIHDNIEVVEVVIRVLRKVFINETSMKFLLIASKFGVEQPDPAQDGQIADHLRVVV